jgi:hypothetical protein
MSSRLTLSSLSYTMGYLVALVALPFLLSSVRNHRIEKLIFAASTVALAIRSAWNISGDFISWDLKFYRRVGTRALDGESPYDIADFMNPPSSIPIFELFGLVGLPTMHRIWTILNTTMLLALPYLSWRVLAEAGDGSEERTGPFPYAAAACVLLALAPVYGIDAGQNQLLTTILILAALGLRSRGRPFLAGFSLAAATLKIGMMVPALTQFCGRGHRRAWLGLAAGAALLTVLGTPLSKVPIRVRENLHNIAGTNQERGHNDIAFENRLSDDLISVARWLYCLGLRDRQVIKRVEQGILGAIGIALAWATATRRLAPDASLAAACAMGTFFLYHRVYDAVLLTPALIYSVAAARREEGWRRAGFIASVLAILAVMNMPRGARFWSLSQWSLEAGSAGRVAQIFVLPYAMWCLFGVMAMLGFASRRERPREIQDGTSPAPSR